MLVAINLQTINFYEKNLKQVKINDEWSWQFHLKVIFCV